MADDQAEIITRPPSHPVASTLLIVSALGTILSIAFVWMELYGEYVPAQSGPAMPVVLKDARTGEDVMGKHNPVTEARSQQTIHDHYAEDFGTGPVLPAVEQELGLTGQVGDAGAGGVPVEAPQ